MGTYTLRVPASRVGYVLEAQGGFSLGPHVQYVLATRTGLGRWVRTAYCGTPTGLPWLSPQVINAPGFLRATWSVVERLMPDWWGVRVGSLQDLGIHPDELV